MHSYHIFYFPFKWDVLDAKDNDLSARLSLANIKPKTGTNWINVGSSNEEEKKALYDEKNYFYKFVHPILYDTFQETSLLKHFKRKECNLAADVCEYRITVSQNNKILEYVLKIDAINLSLYSTGVGILVFYLINEKYGNYDDVLNINQYGRRVFPPFFDDIEKRVQTAESISITGLYGAESRYSEDFSKYTFDDAWKPACFITNLIADLQEDLIVSPVVDDRMFVNCWYQSAELGRKIAQKGLWENFIYSSQWYRFLFIDKGNDTASCQNEKLSRQLIDDTTYLRWQSFGSVFGATKYSFVLVTEKSWYNEHILSVNMRTIYSRMVELVIIQRATMLKFSEEVTHLSVIKSQNAQLLSRRISSLYKEYIRFINKMFFRDITAQDQGDDLYRLLTSQFQSEERIKELDKEINELNEYVTLLMDESRNKHAQWMSILASIFLPATIISGIFGMNSFNSDFCVRDFSIQVLISVLITLITILILRKKLWVR